MRLVEQFVERLDGGEKMTTNAIDNPQSMALIEAAMESSRTDEPARVQEILEETRNSTSIA